MMSENSEESIERETWSVLVCVYIWENRDTGFLAVSEHLSIDEY